ncbi:MAG: hypothetical protein HOE48_10750 [Candidatus Latescibacteria bacterium]|nr:hypothetical protein [Candidatus Latescibacterota bacterium]
MKRFEERDVSHFYDLLQHNPELGLTQLNVLDGDHLIGVGLFDNVEDFLAECKRYNGLGQIHAGVNPRSLNLLDAYGGLKNRIRSLFVDVVTDEDIACVTGIVVRDVGQLTDAAQAYMRDISVLDDGRLFFPMDNPLDFQDRSRRKLSKLLASWVFGEADFQNVNLMRMVSVPGTAKQDSSFFRPRVRFRKFRPFILEGISEAILEQE